MEKIEPIIKIVSTEIIVSYYWFKEDVIQIVESLNDTNKDTDIYIFKSCSCDLLFMNIDHLLSVFNMDIDDIENDNLFNEMLELSELNGFVISGLKKAIEIYNQKY